MAKLWRRNDRAIRWRVGLNVPFIVSRGLRRQNDISERPITLAHAPAGLPPGIAPSISAPCKYCAVSGLEISAVSSLETTISTATGVSSAAYKDGLSGVSVFIIRQAAPFIVVSISTPVPPILYFGPVRSPLMCARSPYLTNSINARAFRSALW